MKIFKEELQRKRIERREKRSSTWGGLLIKIAIFALLVMLIRFIISPQGAKFGDFWQETFGKNGHTAIEVE